MDRDLSRPVERPSPIHAAYTKPADSSRSRSFPRRREDGEAWNAADRRERSHSRYSRRSGSAFPGPSFLTPSGPRSRPMREPVPPPPHANACETGGGPATRGRVDPTHLGHGPPSRPDLTQASLDEWRARWPVGLPGRPIDCASTIDIGARFDSGQPIARRQVRGVNRRPPSAESRSASPLAARWIRSLTLRDRLRQRTRSTA